MENKSVKKEETFAIKTFLFCWAGAIAMILGYIISETIPWLGVTLFVLGIACFPLVFIIFIVDKKPKTEK